MNSLLIIFIAGLILLGLALFAWFLIWMPIRTGSAGYSGISIEKKANPRKFLLTLIGNILGLILVFVILIIALIKSQ